MHQAMNAYARMSQTALAPRELEASVLLRAALRLQDIAEDWGGKRADLDAALTYNRKLWTILATSATAAEHPLPADVKAGIGRLAIFIFQRSLSMLADPDPAKLADLVSINREVAAGLRTPVKAAA